MTIQNMNDLSLEQTADAIAAFGHEQCVLVQGHMGNGKTSILKMLAARFPNHIPCYFNCVTKDLGDLSIPSLNTEEGFVTYLPNEEFGIHLNKPLIIMWDEWSKANQSVKNGTMVTMQERMVGTKKLPEGSMQFATGNLGTEGVGDIIPAHGRNRMTIITVRKSTSDELIAHGINNDWDQFVLGFIREFPQILQGFEDVEHAQDNPYINHPKEQRSSFVTPRSLEAASNILKKRDKIDEQTLTACLAGTLGVQGGLDLMTFVALADQLPSLESIKKDPMNAVLPTSASVIVMVVYRALGAMSRDWVDAWMTYMTRPEFSKEATGLFADGVRANSYVHRNIVMQNKKFTEWAIANNHMFSADKV